MKTVIFDWGGIILKEYPEHYCDRDAITDTIMKYNNSLSYDEAYDIYVSTIQDENGIYISCLNDYESKYKWFLRIKDKGNLNVTYEEFVETFINNYKKIDKYEEVVDFIYSLKGKAKLCLFSDLLFVCYESLANHIDLNIFDHVFLSYVEGYRKSDIDAFKNVDAKLNVDPNNILFIDNMERNINNAKSNNWNAVVSHGYDVESIKENVNNFINNVKE